MSDVSDTAGTPAGNAPTNGGAAPAAGGPPPIQILSQYVKDLSFENPNAPESLRGGQAAPQVKVNVDVRTNKLAENDYEVVLNLKGDATTGDKSAFVVELSYAGVIRIDNGVKKELHAPLLLVEAPRLLFPFARAVIAEASRNGGYPPLLVQPIDFADLFRRQLQAMRAQSQPAGGAPVSTPPVANA